MWEWCYPHLILIILVNVYQGSCQNKASLAFVIDDTYSMGDDIEQVKESANGISEIVFEEKASQVQNMILVTFNDYNNSRIKDAKVVTVTENRVEFKSNIDSVEVDGGGDCPEMAMLGIKTALNASLPGSFIYVFTDASAKDHDLGNEIKILCQKKQSQIVFVLTGHCGDQNSIAYQVYYDIATACSGLVFPVNKNEVKEVLKTIKESIKGTKTTLVATKTKAYQYTDINFKLDNKVQYAIVSVSGLSVSLTIYGPRSTQESLLNLSNAKVIKLSDVTPGVYTVRVWGYSEATLNIVGRTDFIFQHGFSVLEPKSLNDTTPQPIANTKTLLSVAITDPDHTVDILQIHILDLDDRITNSLMLRKISTDFYTTQPFIAPSKRFKISVVARDLKTNKYIQRIGKLSITPQEPPKVMPNTKVPVVSIPEGKHIEVTYGQPLKLTCKVSAYPEPSIGWYKDKSTWLDSKNALVEEPYDYISYLTTSGVTQNTQYMCLSQNQLGRGNATIDITVKDPFVVKSAINGITNIKYGQKAVLACDITAPLPMQIRWYMINEENGARQELITSSKLSITDGGRVLTINNMDFDLQHTYICEAYLNDNERVKSVHTTKVQITGVNEPQIKGDNHRNMWLGSAIDIKCDVTGVPKPTISWSFKPKDGSKFESIPGSSNIHHIGSVQEKHAGTYKCTGHNVLGTKEHQTIVNVRDMPKFTISKNVYEAVEGKDQELRIPCTATGIPQPTISWRVDGKPIPEGTEGTKYSMKDGSLVIREPKVSDSRSYICVANNNAGSSQTNIQVNVLQKPQVVGEKSKTVKKGAAVSLKCDIIKGVPTPSISWYFMAAGASEFVPLKGVTQLSINRSSKEDAGTYKCVAQNKVGRDELSTDFIVQYAPVILSNSKEPILGMEGDVALRILCEVDGVPTPQVKWKINGNIINASDKYKFSDNALTILRPNTNDNNAYVCEAINYMGIDRATFTVRVTSELENYGPRKEVRVLLDSKLKLQCESKDTNQTIVWYLNGKETDVKGNYYEIPRVTLSLEANYTCRVSDVTGGRSHTYEVLVEYPPQFDSAESDVTLDWSGAATDQLLCDANGVPAPRYTWTYNGQVLKGVDSSNLSVSGYWGEYSCNVSNTRGSIQRNFRVISTSCLINRKPDNLKTMPLILSESSTFPILIGTTDYIKLEPQQTIKLSCPNSKGQNNNLQNFPHNEIKATCDKQDIVTIENKPYKISDLNCEHESVFVIENKHIKCLSENSELLRIGFKLNGFLETYEVCFDVSKRIPYFIRSVMTKSNVGSGSSYPYRKYLLTGKGGERSREAYTCEGPRSKECYGKSQLVNVRDFEDGPAQKSTFVDPLNVVPRWRPGGMSKSPWDIIESLIRSRYQFFDQFVSWTGTYKLEKKNGSYIPRYLWKVLRFEEDESIAIVYVNGPSPSEKDILCNNICSERYQVSWIDEVNDHIYCCELEDFLKAFDLQGTTVGEPMEVALEKIMSKTD